MKQNPLNFVYWHGWFDQKYGLQEDIELGGRYFSLKTALSLFLQRGGGNIVETGTTRVKDWLGHGCSTIIFADTLKEFEAGHLWTVDISAESMEVSKTNYCFLILIILPIVSVIHSDFSKKFDQEIDLLYLDSFDYFENEPLLTQCQQHQLSELESAWPKLKQSSIILLDDNAFPGGGKTRPKQTISSR